MSEDKGLAAAINAAVEGTTDAEVSARMAAEDVEGAPSTPKETPTVRPANTSEVPPKDEKVTPPVEKKDDEPPKEKEPPKEEPPKEEENPFRLSAEELDEIDKDPKLNKAYKGMLRGFHARNREVAERRKGVEQLEGILGHYQKDPQMVARAMAVAAGLKLADEAAPVTPTEKAVSKGLEKLTAFLGSEEAAKPFYPILQEIISETVQPLIDPLAQKDIAREQETREAFLNAGLEKFKAEVIHRGDEWSDEIDRGMAALLNKVEPAKGATLSEYLDILYSKVVRALDRKRTSKEELERLQAAETSAEPRRAARPSAPAAKRFTKDAIPSDSDAINAVVAEVMEGR